MIEKYAFHDSFFWDDFIFPGPKSSACNLDFSSAFRSISCLYLSPSHLQCTYQPMVARTQLNQPKDTNKVLEITCSTNALRSLPGTNHSTLKGKPNTSKTGNQPFDIELIIMFCVASGHEICGFELGIYEKLVNYTSSPGVGGISKNCLNSYTRKLSKYSLSFSRCNSSSAYALAYTSLIGFL